jgi:hypothetical protein
MRERKVKVEERYNEPTEGSSPKANSLNAKFTKKKLSTLRDGKKPLIAQFFIPK